ncbi:hypothetical protein Tco_1321860 [Tanacetum coccineum]
MRQEQAQQATHDEKLVSTSDRVKISKSNLIIDPTITQKEGTYQVILDIIKNTPCYNAFSLLPMYLKSTCNSFGLPSKSPRVPNQEFTVPPSSDSLMDFLLELVYKGQLIHISKMFVDQMHQPWRTLGAIINICLSRKTSSNDRLRPSRFEILYSKKATADSKRKRPKKKVSICDESSDEESEEEEERLIRRIPKEINTHRAIKASKHESRLQYQSGGSIKGAGLRPKVPNELTRKFTDSAKGASTSLEVPDKSKDKSKAEDDLDDWGSTDDEEYLLAYKDEKPEDISCYYVSLNFGNQFIGTISYLLDIQIQQDVPHIQQEPFHAVKVSVIPETTQQPLSTPPAPLLQATKIPSTQVPNSEVVNSVIQRFTKLEQAVKELKQADHSTTILASIRSQVPLVVEDYLGSSLPDALKKVLQSYTKELKKELSKKRDYNDVIEESVQANVVTKSTNFCQNQSTIQVAESVSKYVLKKILYAKMHKSQSHLTYDTHQELYDALTWSVLLDEATMKEGDNIDKVLKKRDRYNTPIFDI